MGGVGDFASCGLIGIRTPRSELLASMKGYFNQFQISRSSIDFDFLFSFSVYW